MKPKYTWENLDHTELRRLKNEHALGSIVERGTNEFEKQLLLKNWVFSTLPLGYNNSTQYKSALEVLNDRNNPGGFNCTWYVLTFLQCAQALGWYVRKLGIDTDHGFGKEEMRHTVVDIWSSKHNKWYVIDLMFNVHFEKGAIPLNSYEIRKAYLENNKSVNKVFESHNKEDVPKKFKKMNDTPANYYWFFILLRNNYLENPNVYDSQALLWVDEYNKDKTWYIGGKNKGKLRKHNMYDGAFIETDDLELCFPDVKND